LATPRPVRFDARGFYFACSPRDLPAANWTILNLNLRLPLARLGERVEAMKASKFTDERKAFIVKHCKPTSDRAIARNEAHNVSR